MWAERFDQPIRDLRDGQDSVVQRIGAALNVKFIRDNGNLPPLILTPMI